MFGQEFGIYPRHFEYHTTMLYDFGFCFNTIDRFFKNFCFVIFYFIIVKQSAQLHLGHNQHFTGRGFHVNLLFMLLQYSPNLFVPWLALNASSELL